MPPLRIGTRGSPLALWQANDIAQRLRAVAPDRSIELVEIETEGDKNRDVPLVQLGGQGAFTKAIQQAVLAHRADVAVHSLKDLPTFAVAGLVLAAAPPRGPIGDVLVSRRHKTFDALPRGAVIGTSSLRRQSQLRHRRPDLRLIDLRGNVETRLRKLVDQNLDAIVLAEAGLVRLGLDEHVAEVLDRSWMLPAVGQGALGLECRADDAQTLAVLKQLNHAPTFAAVLAERAMLRGLGGGCQVPIGALSEIAGDRLTLRGVVLPPDGSGRVESAQAGPLAAAEEIGHALATDLLSRGARELLEATPTATSHGA
jgi:hydroxymethylbilane synthase